MLRPERHFADSFETVRMTIAAHLVPWLSLDARSTNTRRLRRDAARLLSRLTQ